MAAAVGADVDDSSVASDMPGMEAYIATDARLPHFPGQDLALLWDEENGWAAALETAASELIVLSYLGEAIVPEPGRVANFFNDVLHAAYPGQRHPPHLRVADTADTLLLQLTKYGADSSR